MSDVQEIWKVFDDGFGRPGRPAPGVTMAEVHRYVRGHVARLLDENPSLLMSILYRIDVAESDVQEVMAHGRHEVIPERLADLIIVRQVEKLRTRRAYRDESEL